MNFFLKIMLCFSFFSNAEERKKEKQVTLRSEILAAFDKKQEASGYEFASRMVFAPDKFKGYMLGYYGEKKFTQDEARRYFVINLENLLSNLNSENRITDSFFRCPLTNEDINILYTNFQSKGIVAKTPYVSAVTNYKDVIEFRFSKSENLEEDEIIRESYDEAYQKVFGHSRAGK